MRKYKIYFYIDNRGKSPVVEYLNKQPTKERAKLFKYINYLAEYNEYLREPYSRRIKGKIRELKISFGNNKYRVFYFIYVENKIVILHVFMKKTQKTPIKEILRALKNYYNFLNKQKYE
ncbi:type II toxin-antitoxin system RelE/ParE family toxin [Patescibacteria group bacterium]|nr:type II toxin-antitoxin system RelE/ParE family toxin [Patescibacteria group bacterium]